MNNYYRYAKNNDYLKSNTKFIFELLTVSHLQSNGSDS